MTRIALFRIATRSACRRRSSVYWQCAAVFTFACGNDVDNGGNQTGGLTAPTTSATAPGAVMTEQSSGTLPANMNSPTSSVPAVGTTTEVTAEPDPPSASASESASPSAPVSGSAPPETDPTHAAGGTAAVESGVGGEGTDESGGGAGGQAGAGGGQAGESSGEPEQAPEPEPQSCVSSSLASGDSDRTVDVAGMSRSYVLHVPNGYDGSSPVPLVLDFHGLGGSGMQQQGSSGYQAVADSEGFLVAFPTGIDSAWNIGPCCTNSRDVDDLAFAKAIVESVATDGCVDLKRVYATGFSMGGGMSHFLACNAADVFAAVTPAAFDLIEATEGDCSPMRPISVLSFRGTNDTVVPYDGGPGSSGRVTFLGAQQTLARWAELNGCTGETTNDNGCDVYHECSDGVQVGLCVAQGGSHAAANASRSWEFLSQFSLP